ncbi:extracellular solute-binding protein [Streptomyces pathocidini]|uniref:Extracellular solute-binding protein n=1 Tax=Streptomyces pathocidini TaxID=1650571 RepID=A0ABW7UP32_9ACTN|nr:extracellular solute-binding protein [Streptomyces pathocidini]
MSASGPSRRTLLQSAAIGTTLAATGFSLSACSSGSGSTSSGGAASGDLAPYPAYVPAKGVPTPDLPGTEGGVQSGYLTYPKELTQSVPEKPGDGSTIRIVTGTWGASPLPKSKNRYWQEIEKALGVELDITVIPFAEYDKKVSAMMASGDTPDVMLKPGSAANITAFQKAKTQDLTDFVSGDAVKKYPNLANIPTYAWEAGGRLDGRIFGVPIERPVAGHRAFGNRDKFEKAGILAPEVGGITVEDFTKGLRDLSGDGCWALGAWQQGAYGFNMWMPAFGTPPVWSFQGGELVHYTETDEFADALEQMAKWQQQGVYRASALSVDGTQALTDFLTGKTLSRVDGSIGYINTAKDPGLKFEIDNVLPFKPSNGADPTHWLTNGIYGQAILKKAAKERIELILRVMNYLAAPFGTKEWELVHHGLEGVHFTRGKDGGPVPTDLVSSKGGGFGNLGLGYISDAPQPLYVADQAEAVKREYEFQKSVIPIAKSSADKGISAQGWTDLAGAVLTTQEDGIKDIVTGRKKFSEWAAIVEEIRRKGVDKGRDAVAQAYEAAKKG